MVLRWGVRRSPEASITRAPNILHSADFATNIHITAQTSHHTPTSKARPKREEHHQRDRPYKQTSRLHQNHQRKKPCRSGTALKTSSAGYWPKPARRSAASTLAFSLAGSRSPGAHPSGPGTKDRRRAGASPGRGRHNQSRQGL
jgi:hypothetical protein